MQDRRKRIDSTASMTEILQNAAKEINPPETVELNDEDLQFFESIIAECPKSEWSQHNTEVAALLARAMADLNREQEKLREEGTTTIGSLGSVIVNPRKSAVQLLFSTVISFRRSLGLDARTRDGDSRNAARRREIAREIERRASLDDDDLIARPH
jgi:hypothetical protein